MYPNFFKRFIDISFCLLIVFALLPILLIIAILLHFMNKEAGIFFFQNRPGKNGNLFNLIKFKTMNEARDYSGKLLPDTQRLTKIGQFIRSTSIDELPQLVNVIKGDMSLIGPRPLLVKYLPLYNPRQARRHDVRPGITGWAQVNGRNAISWEQKFEYDVWYVDHISFLLDIRILWMTFIKVFKREGINSQTATTMEAFNGSEKKEGAMERVREV